MRKISKRGNILTENIIFLILNLMFLAVIVLFLSSRMGGAAVLEEKYSKQVALLLDSAKPGMMIHLRMKDAIDEAEKKLGEENIKNLISIDNEKNIVTVRLQEGAGYSYSFFNEVDATAYLDSTNNLEYLIVVDES